MLLLLLIRFAAVDSNRSALLCCCCCPRRLTVFLGFSSSWDGFIRCACGDDISSFVVRRYSWGTHRHGMDPFAALVTATLAPCRSTEFLGFSLSWDGSICCACGGDISTAAALKSGYGFEAPGIRHGYFFGFHVGMKLKQL